jgi:hypothetical protein
MHQYGVPDHRASNSILHGNHCNSRLSWPVGSIETHVARSLGNNRLDRYSSVAIRHLRTAKAEPHLNSSFFLRELERQYGDGASKSSFPHSQRVVASCLLRGYVIRFGRPNMGLPGMGHALELLTGI